MDLIKQANAVYSKNHPPTAHFERCIFLSWWCTLGDCDFCYRSTQKSKIDNPKEARRNPATIYAEALFIKNVGWELEFLTGGYGIYSLRDMVEITKNVSHILGKKVWINLGFMSAQQLDAFRPYIMGIVASVETVNPELAKKVTPSKPLEAFNKTLKAAVGLEKSISIVLGIGETLSDIEQTINYIREYDVTKISLFPLHPIPGTPYEKGPTPEYVTEWVARLRIAIPTLTIVVGTVKHHPGAIENIMRAGANAMTKFPATKQFGTPVTHHYEQQIRDAGRTMIGSLTTLPNVDWDAQIQLLDFDEGMKKRVKDALDQYLSRMQKNVLTVIV